MGSLITILLIVVILILGFNAMKPENQKSAFVISRRTHYKLLAFFIAFLIMATVIAEIFNSKINSAIPLEKVGNNHYNEEFDSIDNQIVNREAVDPALLLEKRTHPAGQSLTIKFENNHLSDGPTPFIYIERKEAGDQTIEEFLYKPLLIVDDYNFSNAIDVAKPIWTENKMTLPQQSINDIANATFFYDASLLQQLTKNRHLQSNGFSSMHRTLTIHLKIPADLQIVDTDEDYIFFIE